jgi:hypothetical protein
VLVVALTVRSATRAGSAEIVPTGPPLEQTASAGKTMSTPHRRAISRAPANMCDIGGDPSAFGDFRAKPESVPPGNKKAAAAPTTRRIRWRLGWHGGFPLQPRGSVPPSFDGFTLGSVRARNSWRSMPLLIRTHARRAINKTRSSRFWSLEKPSVIGQKLGLQPTVRCLRKNSSRTRPHSSANTPARTSGR